MNETNNSASMSGSWPNNMMSSGAMPSGDLPNNSGSWDEFAPPEERKKLAFDLWRSLPDVNSGIPEDLIADELCAASRHATVWQLQFRMQAIYYNGLYITKS